MTRDIIEVLYPQLEDSQSLAKVSITKQEINPTNGVTINSAFDNKNNSLVICIENTTESDKQITFKSGQFYPNAKLGDLNVPVLASTVNFYQVQDPSRFEKADGSIDIDFATGMTGYVYAVAKSVAFQ